ncbi:MAG: hypothetical protein U9O41_03615 [Candidatus Aerophobetes bacterium]|nr:hypothetical protein [Candidatus Aerophobetes bacterium]
MKSINDVGSSIRDVKTARGGNLRATPRPKGSAYLDLFMLTKEKEKLEKEESNLEKRKMQIQKRLEEIAQQIEILKKDLGKQEKKSGGEKTFQARKTSGKNWRTVSLGY